MTFGVADYRILQQCIWSPRCTASLHGESGSFTSGQSLTEQRRCDTIRVGLESLRGFEGYGGLVVATSVALSMA
jgi:hypothetical protein